MPAIGFRTGLKGAKANFFDRAAVEKSLDRGTSEVLSRFGYFVMRDSRQRIRRRKSASKPGSGPTNLQGLLKDKPGILFHYDRDQRSVVIGPVRIRGRIAELEIPRLLEEGGRATITRGYARGKTYTLKPRPYMQPAFQRQLPKLPDLWQKAANRRFGL